jgi:hypothetical protein
MFRTSHLSQGWLGGVAVTGPSPIQQHCATVLPVLIASWQQCYADNEQIAQHSKT